MKRVYLGIDAGFSATGRSTGICVLAPNSSEPVRCLHVKTQHTIDATLELLDSFAPLAAAIDGPLVLDGTAAARYTTINRYRRCEQLLSGGIFQKRCKPGPTNSPRGLALHKQATFLANHLLSLFPKMAISEAFPNAFMGVMLPDAVFQGVIRRGIKSDVFWDYCFGDRRFMQRLVTHLLGEDSPGVFRASRRLSDHDERAAFICALTACAAHKGKMFLVNGGVDGAITLPPERFIQPWASKVLKSQCLEPQELLTAAVLG